MVSRSKQQYRHSKRHRPHTKYLLRAEMFSHLTSLLLITEENRPILPAPFTQNWSCFLFLPTYLRRNLRLVLNPSNPPHSASSQVISDSLHLSISNTLTFLFHFWSFLILTLIATRNTNPLIHSYIGNIILWWTNFLSLCLGFYRTSNNSSHFIVEHKTLCDLVPNQPCQLIFLPSLPHPLL